MPRKPETALPDLIERHQKQLLDDWLSQQRSSGALGADDPETKDQSARFLTELRKGAATGRFDDIEAPEWATTRELLDEVSRARATMGFTPSQTATFVFSLKEPLFSLLRQEMRGSAEKLVDEIWVATLLLDKLGLYTTEVYQKNREEVIARQQEELLELSTPVVELWEGILALPLIGTLDSARTQIVMENLLQQIVTSGAEIAIIDITGVPTVDTLVAQHLIKTISAARLMGADCIISGIRPQIAQTIVHLGVDLSVTSKATMADAFQLALRRIGKSVAGRAKPSRTAE
ncbi:MAG TPA: STAS domain-containing protein [Stellaceae bacterium]